MGSTCLPRNVGARLRARTLGKWVHTLLSQSFMVGERARSARALTVTGVPYDGASPSLAKVLESDEAIPFPPKTLHARLYLYTVSSLRRALFLAGCHALLHLALSNVFGTQHVFLEQSFDTLQPLFYRVILVVSNKLLLTVFFKFRHLAHAVETNLSDLLLPKQYRAGSGTTMIQSTKVCCHPPESPV